MARTKLLSPEEKQRLIDKHNRNRFAERLGIILTDLDYGYARSMLVVDENHLNFQGTLHGGVLLSLADHTGGAAGIAMAEEAYALQANMYYMASKRVSMGETIYAEAKFIREGSRVAFLEVDVFDEKHVLIAKASFTGIKMQL